MLKIPPHNLEAEESVLGALLIDKDAITAIGDILKPDHFYSENHSVIFEAMVDLYEAREPIDLVTLANKLKKVKKLNQIGGTAYLTKLSEAVPTAGHVEHYARIIKDDFTKRELIQAAAAVNELAFDVSISTEQILDEAEQKIFGLSQQHLKTSFIHIKEALADSFDRLDELHKSTGGLRGLATGFTDLDNTLAGMQASNLLILAARPGMGKTALALNIAQYAAIHEGKRVGFFSLEMSKEELLDRLLVAQANIDAWKLKTGRLAEDEYAKLADAMGVLAESNLYIDDTPGMSVLEMRTKARRLAADGELGLIIIDYLTLARPNRKHENRVQEVSEISMGFKNLAKELKVPVLALAQLNRSIEHRTGAPQLADLRESGSIEQDADVVMFLYREDSDDLQSVKLNIAKHRNGPLKTIDLRFVGNRLKFFSVDVRHEA
jgi:replicative DNA helicase